MFKRFNRFVCVVLMASLVLLGCPRPVAADAPPATTGLDALARLAPLNTQVFLAVDLRSRFTLAEALDALDRLKQAQPQLAQRVEETEAMLGVTLRDVSRWASPAGLVAVYPHPGELSIASGQAFDALAALPVADEAAARAFLEKVADHYNVQTRPTTLADGTQAWLVGEGAHAPGYTVAHGLVLVGTSQEVLTDALARVSDGPNLTQQPFYRDLRGKLTAADGLVAFVGLHDILDGVDLKTSKLVDGETLKPLLALKYLGGTMTGVEGRLDTQVFLKLDNGSESPLVQALLAAQPNDLALARYFPARWGNYGSVDATWLGHVVLAAVQLVPALRVANADMVSGWIRNKTGLDLAQDLAPAFQGSFAGSSNLLDILPDYIHMREKPTMTGAQDRALVCQRNLLNIGTALEMYAVDHRGRYPTRLAGLVPAYLKYIPKCPEAHADTYSATYHAEGRRYAFACGGAHHLAAHLQANQPAYNSRVGLSSRVRITLPAPPLPTSLLAVRVTDADKAQAALEKFGQHLHLGLTAGPTVENTVIYRTRNRALPSRYALVRGAVPALLVATGPKAETYMEDALHLQAGTAAGTDASVASLPGFAALAQGVTGHVISSQYLNLKSLTRVWIDVLKSSVARMPREGRDVSALAVKTAETMAPPEGTSVTEVLPDGIHYSSRGTPTELISLAAGVGLGWYVAHMHRSPAHH